MTDLDQLLAHIDTTIDECDASTLPALPAEPVDEQPSELIAAPPNAPIEHRSRLIRWLLGGAPP